MRCPTDCTIIQEAMCHDEAEIEALIEYEKKHGAKCQGCEYNEVSNGDNTNSN